MQQEFVDLYEKSGQNRPNGGRGYLSCYIQQTISVEGYTRLRPAVLIIPGGGYGHVSPREGEPVALRFLARGYQAFVLEYSVAPVGFPAPLQEAAMAMAYIRAHSGRFGVDPKMVAAVGFSAGGHLCGLLGTLFDGEEVAMIGSPAAIRPDALGLCYPVAVSWGRTHDGSFHNLCGTDAQLRQRLSLDGLVRADMPPVYLWHTESDESVPCRNSLILKAALDTAGVSATLRLYQRGIHGLSTADAQVFPVGKIPDMSPEIPAWPEEMMGFFHQLGLKIKDLEQKL